MTRLFACLLLAICTWTSAAMADPQSQQERLKQSDAFHAAGNYTSAYQIADALAKEGYAPAYGRLGQLYSEGNGVAQSKMLARHWYSKGAENGDVMSTYNMGIYNDVGIAGPKDPTAALAYYKRAADLGDAKGAFNAGQMLVTGDGVPMDPEAGAALIQTAADAGVGAAQLTLGYMHKVGLGVPVSIMKTEKYYRAAMAGDEVSKEARARLWDFEDDMIARGRELTSAGQIEEAVLIFDDLCGAGNGDACYYLGRRWVTGAYEARPNYDMAMPSFRRGCILDSYYACAAQAYGTVDSPATPSTSDRDQAAKFFTDLCDWGEQDKCLNLAYMKYYTRFGMTDYEGTKSLLMNACLNEGYQKACQPYYDIFNAEVARRNAASQPQSTSRRNWGILDGLTALAEGMAAYSGSGSYTSYSGGSSSSSSSSSSFTSSSSAQDTRDFNNAINAINSIGTGYNSSCRSGNPYC